MAFACDGHGGVTPRPIRGFYATLLDSGKRYTSYKHYCINCLIVVLKDHHDDWIPGGPAYMAQSVNACTNCATERQDNGPLSPFYVTTWSRTNQRVDYCGYYCRECADTTIGVFGLKETANGRG